MEHPKYSNCLIFTLNMWARYGGYVIVRKSRYGWWPHFMWAKSIEGLEITEFTPERKALSTDKLKLPPPLFKGKY